MNFNVQPSGVVGANSPIIYQFFDALFASANFYYKVEVFVWTGTTTIPASPIATIERVPDTFASGRAFVDIHKIVQQYLTNDFFTASGYKVNVNGGAVNCAVKVQGFYTGGSTSLITSNVVLATNGYTYMSDGFNDPLVTTSLLKLYVVCPTIEFGLNPLSNDSSLKMLGFGTASASVRMTLV